MEHIDYTIGDDIVSIRTHSQLLHKEGQTYVCKGLLPCNCKCCSNMVNIGIKSKYDVKIGGIVKCPSCGICYPFDGIAWVNAAHFKKLDTLVDISELTEVLEQPAFS